MVEDRFEQLTEEELQLHAKKRNDYGKKGDPLANVRSAAEFGVDPWIGALIRLNDKVTRLKNAATGTVLVNESVADSLADISVYAKIARILFEEQYGEVSVNGV